MIFRLMETPTALLIANGYTRTDLPISKPLVIHAVAGAGKTTLIRQFLHQHSATNAQTLGTPDKPNLSRKMIRQFSMPKANHFNILDEYCAQPLKGSWDAVFADPLQHPDYALEPHFIKETSHRLGPSTCELISSLGILIYPDSEDQVVTRKGVFESELFGVVIALDEAIFQLASRHGLKPLCPKATIGLQFPVVTVLSSLALEQIEDSTALYIALTRHTKELHVRCPTEADAST